MPHNLNLYMRSPQPVITRSSQMIDEMSGEYLFDLPCMPIIFIMKIVAQEAVHLFTISLQSDLLYHSP